MFNSLDCFTSCNKCIIIRQFFPIHSASSKSSESRLLLLLLLLLDVLLSESVSLLSVELELLDNLHLYTTIFKKYRKCSEIISIIKCFNHAHYSVIINIILRILIIRISENLGIQVQILFGSTNSWPITEYEITIIIFVII